MGPKTLLPPLSLSLHRRAELVRKAERARSLLARPPGVPPLARPIDLLPPPSFADERRALRVMVDGLRDAVGSVGIGDCFAFGLRNDVSASALSDTLRDVGLDRVRRFSWACSLPRTRGAVDFGSGALGTQSLREMRSRYRVRRVSVVLMGNDFPPGAGALLQQLEPMLADQVLWIVCSQCPVPTVAEALAELSAQHQFAVLPVGTFAAGAGASWLALRLRRRYFV